LPIGRSAERLLLHIKCQRIDNPRDSLGVGGGHDAEAPARIMCPIISAIAGGLLSPRASMRSRRSCTSSERQASRSQAGMALGSQSPLAAADLMPRSIADGPADQATSSRDRLVQPR